MVFVKCTGLITSGCNEFIWCGKVIKLFDIPDHWKNITAHPLPSLWLFLMKRYNDGSTVACWKRNNSGKEGVALFDGEENIY